MTAFKRFWEGIRMTSVLRQRTRRKRWIRYLLLSTPTTSLNSSCEGGAFKCATITELLKKITEVLTAQGSQYANSLTGGDYNGDSTRSTASRLRIEDRPYYLNRTRLTIDKQDRRIDVMCRQDDLDVMSRRKKGTVMTDPEKLHQSSTLSESERRLLFAINLSSRTTLGYMWWNRVQYVASRQIRKHDATSFVPARKIWETRERARQQMK